MIFCSSHVSWGPFPQLSSHQVSSDPPCTLLSPKEGRKVKEEGEREERGREGGTFAAGGWAAGGMAELRSGEGRPKPAVATTTGTRTNVHARRRRRRRIRREMGTRRDVGDRIDFGESHRVRVQPFLLCSANAVLIVSSALLSVALAFRPRVGSEVPAAVAIHPDHFRRRR
jgi:hypothetical protein